MTLPVGNLTLGVQVSREGALLRVLALKKSPWARNQDLGAEAL